MQNSNAWQNCQVPVRVGPPWIFPFLSKYSTVESALVTDSYQKMVYNITSPEKPGKNSSDNKSKASGKPCRSKQSYLHRITFFYTATWNSKDITMPDCSTKRWCTVSQSREVLANSSKNRSKKIQKPPSFFHRLTFFASKWLQLEISKGCKDANYIKTAGFSKYKQNPGWSPEN